MTTLVPFDLVAWLAKNAPEEPKAARPKQAVRAGKAPADALGRYLMRALADEVAKVADAPDGQRNDQLNKSAFALGQLIPCGLSRSDVERQLTAAAEVAKLGSDETFTTINSGIESGILEPRDLSHVGRKSNRENSHGPAGYATQTNGDGHHQRDETATGELDYEAMGAEEAERIAKERREKHSLPSFENYKVVEVEIEGGAGETKEVKVAKCMSEIEKSLRELSGPWPRRIVETLFAETSNYEPVYLGTAPRLFAWIGRFAHVDWAKGSRFISQEVFFEHLRMMAERFEAIESIPHWPPIEGIYYMHRPVPKPAGKLDGFLNFFTPHGEEDRELIKALVITPFWGGGPGRRPAVLVTGPDHDPEQGRGVGKTTMLDVIFDELLGGSIDVSPTADMDVVKTRLLSDQACRIRAARIDNIKTLKLSWADLEGLITAASISGHAMYKGEGRRPNTLIWGLTLNGASLSKDMAQRCAIIKLGRPVFTADWEERVRNYVREHRWEIIADIGKILTSEAGSLVPKTRWAAWEQGVLSKVGHAERCQELVYERMMTADTDNEEKELVAEHFREKLTLFHHDPDDCCVFIPSKVAGEWLADACQEKRPTNRATAYLSGLGIPELRKSKKGQPGWAWTGPKARIGTSATWFDRRPTNGAAY